MKTQAVKCSTVEIEWLNFWRREGYRIALNQAIPCNANTPPRRPPILPRLLKGLRTVAMGMVIIGGIVGLAMLWMSKAAVMA